MKNLYRISSFNVFSTLSDRGLKYLSQEQCERYAEWLREGTTLRFEGIKVKSEGTDKFRVYKTK